MFKVYTTKNLAKTLDEIAQGNTYSADALLAAKLHPVATSNDCQMLNRWLFGNWTSVDAHDLMQLAIYIRQAGGVVKLNIK